MLKEIFKPKNFTALMWLFASVGAAAALFFKHASISGGKCGKADIYKLGNHAAFVTNKKPRSAAADAAKNFFVNNNF